MPHTLPPLPYANEALEPHIDAKTMEIHHDKHHGAYVTNLNAALEKAPDLANRPLDELLKNLSAVPEAVRTKERNKPGGPRDPTPLWLVRMPEGGGAPTGALADAVQAPIRELGQFQARFPHAGGDT